MHRNIYWKLQDTFHQIFASNLESYQLKSTLNILENKKFPFVLLFSYSTNTQLQTEPHSDGFRERVSTFNESWNTLSKAVPVCERFSQFQSANLQPPNGSFQTWRQGEPGIHL